MVTVAALLVTAATFWSPAAPGIAQQNCPDGVRYNVRPATQLANYAKVHGVIAEAVPDSCVITFRAGWRRDTTDRQACRIVLHEYGHAALGLDHDAGGVMVPSEDPDATTPGICFRYSNSERTLAH